MDKVTLFRTDKGDEITFEDLLKQIWTNSTEKQIHILNTAEHLKNMIGTIQDAVIIMPSMIQLQDVSIKNDDQLVKMAAIVQRMQSKVSKKSDTMDYGMSAEERAELMETVRKSQIPAGSSSRD